MEFKDYYKILGISKDASPAQVKDAYRKLARKLHPDLNPNDKEAKTRFQEVNEANEVLSDPEKRKKYDQYGKDWKHAEEFERARQDRQSGSGGPFGGYSGSASSAREFDDEDFSEFFQSMFGGMGGGRSGGRVHLKGPDYQAELRLGLKDAYVTHQHTLNVNGKNIRITVPAGISDGQVIVLRGHGGRGTNGGPDGDLYITFIITQDPMVKRTGNDLYMAIDLDLYTAVLGGEIEVDTLDGKVKLKVAPETQNATQVRLRGKGFPLYKEEGRFGDLYITYRIKIPTQLNDKQKELFKELSKL